MGKSKRAAELAQLNGYQCKPGLWLSCAALLLFQGGVAAAQNEPNVPATPDFEFEMPDIPEFEIPEVPEFDLMLPGDKDPIPDSSDADILLNLKVTRRGDADLKLDTFFYEGLQYWRTNEETHWTHGPYELEARLYANTDHSEVDGRQTILRFLRQWGEHRDHYLSILESYAQARTQSGVDPQRRAYYAKLDAEIRRIVEAARLLANDVAFLEALMERQRTYDLGTERYGPIDERSPLTAQVSFAGGQVRQRFQGGRVYFGRFDGVQDQTVERTILASEFEIVPGIPELAPIAGFDGPPPKFEFVPNVSVSVFDVSRCQTDQLEILILSLDKRFTDLTPKPVSAFDFDSQEADWYEETTRPILTRIFRETYRQAVYEAVRYAWAFSDAEMPADMQLGAREFDQQRYIWHSPYESPASKELWVDHNGVPIIKDGANLRLPTDLNGRHMRIYVAEAGGRSPADLWNLYTYKGFNRVSLQKTMSPGTEHDILTWEYQNSQEGRAEYEIVRYGDRKINTFEISEIEPAWRGGGYSHTMQTDAGMIGYNWDQPRTPRVFKQADLRDTSQGSLSDYSRAPKMHLLKSQTDSGTVSATLALRYSRDLSDPDTGNIDRGTQNVEIELEVKPASARLPDAYCPGPVLDEAPELRLVQMWATQTDGTFSTEFRPVNQMWPGHPYFIEAEFEEAPPEEAYRVEVSGRGTVLIKRTNKDDALFRSEMITFDPGAQPR